MSSDGRRRGTMTRGCFLLVMLISVVLAGLGAGYVVYALLVPSDAPLACMYRTEADIAALVKAVEMYHSHYAVFPPAGPDGLTMAVHALSQQADYFPGGPPLDGWGRAYCYVPSNQYMDPAWNALKAGVGYYAPDGYQIYSVGADGEAGLDQTDRSKDNITSWDKARSWRSVYRAMRRLTPKSVK